MTCLRPKGQAFYMHVLYGNIGKTCCQRHAIEKNNSFMQIRWDVAFKISMVNTTVCLQLIAHYTDAYFSSYNDPLNDTSKCINDVASTILTIVTSWKSLNQIVRYSIPAWKMFIWILHLLFIPRSIYNCGTKFKEMRILLAYK